jgi:hypothetical protein
MRNERDLSVFFETTSSSLANLSGILTDSVLLIATLHCKRVYYLVYNIVN